MIMHYTFCIKELHYEFYIKIAFCIKELHCALKKT